MSEKPASELEILPPPKKNGRPRGSCEFSDAQVAQMIVACRGNVSIAAKRLGYAWSTMRKRMSESQELRDAVVTGRGQLLDLAEAALEIAIKQGDTRAIIFALSTQGADRGWKLGAQTNVSVAVGAGGITGTPEERQAKLLEAAKRLRASALAESAGKVE